MLLSDFRLTPPAPVAAPGVLFCCVLEQKNSSRAAAARGELAVAAQALAQQQGAGTSWQRMLVSDAHTSRWLEALAPTPRWEVHRSVNGVARRNEQFLRRHPKLDRKSAGFVWKLAALLLSPFERTVFLDNDVVVLRPDLIEILLGQSLKISDLAMPVDPRRYWRPRGGANVPAAGRRTNLPEDPTMFTAGIPPVCSCMMAWRRTPSVSELFESAASLLLERAVPRDIGTGARGVRRAARALRQGDQEMIFTQLVHGRSAAAKPSLLVLPEEYYCPGVSAWSGKAALPYVWSTSFGEYPCYAVHGHELAANMTERNAALGLSS